MRLFRQIPLEKKGRRAGDSGVFAYAEVDIGAVLRRAVERAANSAAWSSPLDGWQIDAIVDDACAEIRDGEGDIRRSE